MPAKNKESKYTGVTYDPARSSQYPYRAWIRVGKKVIQLKSFATEREAVLAADFSRYLCWGPEPLKWPFDGKKPKDPPTGAPYRDLPFDPNLIIRKLRDKGAASAVTLAFNNLAYIEKAEKIADSLSRA